MNLPDHAVAVGTADHGHVDVPFDRRVEIPRSLHDDHDFGGDPRLPFVYGDVESIAEATGTAWLPRGEMAQWWGTGARQPAFDDRAPNGVLVPEPLSVAFHKHADERLVGHRHQLLENLKVAHGLICRGQ